MMSNRRCTASVTGSTAAAQTSARMPNGRLMKNTQRQSKLSVSQPPMTGPRMGPTMMPTPHQAIALPCCDCGQTSSR